MSELSVNTSSMDVQTRRLMQLELAGLQDSVRNARRLLAQVEQPLQQVDQEIRQMQHLMRDARSAQVAESAADAGWGDRADADAASSEVGEALASMRGVNEGDPGATWSSPHPTELDGIQQWAAGRLPELAAKRVMVAAEVAVRRPAAEAEVEAAEDAAAFVSERVEVLSRRAGSPAAQTQAQVQVAAAAARQGLQGHLPQDPTRRPEGTAVGGGKPAGWAHAAADRLLRRGNSSAADSGLSR